jgi:hypothetical protein
METKHALIHEEDDDDDEQFAWDELPSSIERCQYHSLRYLIGLPNGAILDSSRIISGASFC